MKRLKKIVITGISEIKKHKQNPVVFSQRSDVDSIVAEVQRKGVCVLPDFLSKNQCERICEEIDRMLTNNKVKTWKDDQDSDHRIFGAEKYSQAINDFLYHSLLDEVASSYMGEKQKARLCLAAKLVARSNNKGSGGGWHRDISSKKQIKAIVYLSDVDEKNGPFQYLMNSHRSLDFIKKVWEFDFDLNQTRFTEEQMLPVLASSQTTLQTFEGKAGTVLLVDTSGIHRGKPIEIGERYALTNYLWSNSIPSSVAKLSN